MFILVRHTYRPTRYSLQRSSTAYPTERPTTQTISEERSDESRLRKTARSLIHQILNIDNKDNPT
jgi:hypothetical protein